LFFILSNISQQFIVKPLLSFTYHLLKNKKSAKSKKSLYISKKSSCVFSFFNIIVSAIFFISKIETTFFEVLLFSHLTLVDSLKFSKLSLSYQIDVVKSSSIQLGEKSSIRSLNSLILICIY
jgi:hypothetical protein